MSAIDELRRMLDERGVEWGTGFGGDTLWTGRHGIEWRWDKQEGTISMYSHVITPEQAIAATLGDNGKSRWHELFGTPERAARTLVNLNCDGSGCDGCSLGDIECDYGYDALLEWLEGETE